VKAPWNRTLRRSMTGRLSTQERAIRARWYRWVRHLRDRFYRDEGKSDRHFARDVGITPGAFSSMMSRNRDIGISTLTKVLVFFRREVPDLTLDMMTFTDAPSANGSQRHPPKRPHSHK